MTAEPNPPPPSARLGARLRDCLARPSRVGDSADQRRWTLAGASGGIAALVVQTWMLTGGTWNLLRWSRTADFYDEQAHSILDGTLAMDPRVLGIESFSRGENAYMYFGPVPALFRLPIAAVTDRFDGRLSALSMLAALVVTVLIVLGIGWRLRTRVLGDLVVTRGEAAGTAALMFVIFAGSSLLFAASRTWVYHEAIMWGVAWTMASYAALLLWLDGHGARFLGWAAFATTGAMLTRPSIGGGALAALAAVLAWSVIDRHRDRWRRVGPALARMRLAPDEGPPPRFGRLTAAVAVPVVAYALVNWLKFRSLFSVPFDQQGFTLLSAQRRAMLEANGGSLFNWRFLPTNVVSYTRPDTVRVDDTFPLVHIRPSSLRIGNPVYDLVDLTAGLPATMPLLVALAAIGLVIALRADPSMISLRPVLVGCVLGTLPVLSIGYLANRYQSDFLPVLIIPALVGAPALTGWLRRRPPNHAAPFVVVAALLGTFGVATNAALAYTYQRAASPAASPSELASYIDMQRRFDGWIGDGRLDHVTQGARLPAVADLGDVFIVGDCDALYWSDGRESFDLTATPWKGVQRAVGKGGFAATIVFDELAADTVFTNAMPVVRVGGENEPAIDATTVFVIVDPHRGTVTFGLSTQEETKLGPDMPYRPNRPLDLDVVADPRVGVLEVRLDGRLALFAGHDGATTIVPAPNTADGAAADVIRFQGTITPRAVDMSLCGRLLDSVR